MLLLVLGTVAQRYIGLYASQKLFFGSFILWAGPFPLPGAYSVLAFIAFSISAKLLLASPFSRQQLGVILTHTSALVLLLGGLITALCREEGYVVLGEGESTHFVSDYHDRALTVSRNGVELLALSPEEMHVGDTVGVAPLPFTLSITRYCYPCMLVPRQFTKAVFKGLAKDVDITAKTPSSEESQNQAAVLLGIRGAGAADGIYLASEMLKEQPDIAAGSDHYTFKIEPTRRALPFSVKLQHFDKSDYPGTDMAKSYTSHVTINDNSAEWNAIIEMNQPLRYRGYTLYQSSFVENDGKLLSVLAVVNNAGAWFPYIAISMLCAGLLLHIVVTFIEKARR